MSYPTTLPMDLSTVDPKYLNEWFKGFILSLKTMADEKTQLRPDADLIALAEMFTTEEQMLFAKANHSDKLATYEDIKVILSRLTEAMIQPNFKDIDAPVASPDAAPAASPDAFSSLAFPFGEAWGDETSTAPVPAPAVAEARSRSSTPPRSYKGTDD